MRYIKIIMFLSIVFTFNHLKINGQDADIINIESQVVDQGGIPVFNATIIGDNGRAIKRTDPSGNFAISVPEKSVLHINAEGFLTKSIKAEEISGQVILVKDTSDYMVNVGFREILNADKAGGITVISPKKYAQYDYEPFVVEGVGGRFNDWGLGMLLLIDGIARDYQDIRLEEIEQITVLKGVNAVAIYGSYAANGVILITTKRGELNDRNIKISASSGINVPKKYPSYLGSVDYMTLYNEARENDGLSPLYTESTIQNFASGNQYQYPDIDYYSSEYLRDFVSENDVTLDFSTGGENAKFYSNLGWFNNSSLLNVGEGQNEKYNRFNVRGNIDLKINDFITAAVDVSTIIRNNRVNRANYWAQAGTMLPNKVAPLLPLDAMSADSVTIISDNSRSVIDDKYILGGSQEILTNPIADLYIGGYNVDVSRNIQMTNLINFDLGSMVEGLSLHSKINADYYNVYRQFIENEYAVYSPTWGESGSELNQIVDLSRIGSDKFPGVQNIGETRQVRNLGISLYFKYLKTINNVHNVSVFLIGNGTSITETDEYQSFSNTNIGMQLTYNYDHKYWADFSGNMLNSKKLPEDNRMAFSPTISLGWLLSEEGFLSGASSVDRLKLSISTGILNSDIYIPDYYMYDNIYSLNNYFGYSENLSNRELISLHGANPDLTFVKRKEISTTLEGSLYKNLLSFEANFFITTIDGGITVNTTQYPSWYYDFAPVSNYNIEKRTGLDLMLEVNKKVGKIDLNVGVNALYMNSEIVQRDELYKDDYQYRAGKPIDVIFGLENEGLFENETDIANHELQSFGEVRPGDIKYKDQNGDNIINENDYVEIGRYNSPFRYSLHILAKYKNFSLYLRSFGIHGGNGIKNNDYYWVDGDDKYSEVVNGRWIEGADNSSATFPRLSSQENPNNFRVSDYWLYKTDRFMLDKVQLTYTLSMSKMRNRFIGGIDIYINGSNLLILSENKDIFEINPFGQPSMRYFSAGIKASF